MPEMEPIDRDATELEIRQNERNLCIAELLRMKRPDMPYSADVIAECVRALRTRSQTEIGPRIEPPA